MNDAEFGCGAPDLTKKGLMFKTPPNDEWLEKAIALENEFEISAGANFQVGTATADIKAREQGRIAADHCHDSGCPNCFGQ